MKSKHQEIVTATGKTEIDLLEERFLDKLSAFGLYNYQIDCVKMDFWPILKEYADKRGFKLSSGVVPRNSKPNS